MRLAALARLYPARWRARYGAEFEAMLEEIPASPRVVFDVLSSALRARVAELLSRSDGLRPAGGPGAPRQARTHANLAAALLLPTLVLLGSFALKFKLGVDEPFDVVWPIARDRLGAIQYVLVLLPCVSLALAARSLVCVSWGGGRITVSVGAERANRWSVVVAAASVSVLYLLGRYFIAQHLIAPISAPWPWFPPPWEWR